jgi:alpha-1,2-mannosyltransferase
VSGTSVTGEAAGASAGEPGGEPGSTTGIQRGFRLTPVGLAITVATVVALGLRLYQLTRPGYLLSVTEYDDGPYFGSALRLVSGVLPYRDFLLVQPPGITLLMVPAALLGKVTGTAWAMACGRILTCAAGAATVTLAGLLVRHRGLIAVIGVCGVSAVFPDSVQAAHTVLVEPWLALFCLAGAVAVFDRDRLTASGRRLAWGGLAFGFAGAVEVWAIFPVLVIAVLGLRHLRRLGWYLGGVAAGFLIPVVPFAALDPRNFYDGLVVAQVGGRLSARRVSTWYRLREMAGLSDLGLSHQGVAIAVVLIIGLILAGLWLAGIATRRLPPLDVFAVATTGAVAVAFLWPVQFHYHFSAFLAPFLAMAVTLPWARVADGGRPAPGPSRAAAPARTAYPLPQQLMAVAAAMVIVVMAVIQARSEIRIKPHLAQSVITTATRLIPRGACLVTDEVSFAIMANRFDSDVPGCPVLVDSIGTDYAMSHGLDPGTGAARYASLVAVWRNAFGHAQYVWLSGRQAHRIPWTPRLEAYFRGHFTRIYADGRAGQLFRRNGL